ncbi:MAG: sigma-54 dependent transcriptional regulator [Syntrophobacter sp.]
MLSDFGFFREAMLHMTSSLDLAASSEKFFYFLKNYFPISALSLHQYSPKHNGLKLLFLVTDKGFFYVEKLLPIPTQSGRALLNGHGTPFSVLIEPLNEESPVASLHSRAIREYIPLKPRAYMVGILGFGTDVVGHMVFIGDSPDCFTEEHARLVKMLLPPFSLAMANMLQFKRTVEFQNRLDIEKTQLEVENRLLREHTLVGSSVGLKKVFEAIRQLGGRDIPVLILGETGTGKELVADAVQQISGRRGGPFVKVNCGAIPESLMDSELFGFEKGAFTGANSARPGRFEQADGGTLFLDELGELSPQAQVRLLRVLQDGVVQRLGSVTPTLVDVRIIAATNRNMERMILSGKFREDLYYRLNVFPIRIPPLRERCEDIPLLIGHFVSRISARWGMSAPPVDLASLEALTGYAWPGNVRELENLVERVLILEPSGPLDFARHLPRKTACRVNGEGSNDSLQNLIDDRLRAVLGEYSGRISRQAGLDPDEASGEETIKEAALPSLDTVMTEHINKALMMSRGKINGPGGAAEILRLHPNTLRKRMSKLGIVKPGLTGARLR